ncbi:hypothetical protein BHAOGJBA_1735 [Methylobacterium hispanicum]|uniref:Uncharacterized protein n=1 Tax=Methylobacterium hispanicum TaxID=270350 RepID=A0AAV4ZIK9_9HYPH|nr:MULTISPECIES: hypothetical protein [Methylobacterium]GJD88222.1 hypothetical protein BHAOGJBA_1735 [Methylobacterium hispanicum]
MTTPDPIHAAIASARAASAAHIAACKGLDEDDEAAVARCNEACDADAEASKALAKVLPTTPAGLIALVAFYAEDGEGTDTASLYLDRILVVLKHPDSERLFAGLSPQIASAEQALGRVIPQAGFEAFGTMPGLSDIEAAWHGLPAETRNRIGVTAVDMVFQEFIHGDACVVNGQPEDRPFPGETEEHIAIRCAAMDATNQRLNELTPLIEGALPDLFGSDGENPAWCPNPGPRP